MDKEIKAISIQILDKGFLVVGSVSPHTLGPMNVYSAACQTTEEVHEEVGKLLDNTIDEAPAEVPVAGEQKSATQTFSPAESVTSANRELAIQWLTDRGVEVPKGTRNPTIEKMIAESLGKVANKEEPAADQPPVVEPAAEEPQLAAPAESPTASPSECPMCSGTGKLLGTDVQCPHCGKDAPLDQNSILMAGSALLNAFSDKRNDIRAALAAGLAKVGVKSMREVKDFPAAWAALSEEISKAIAPAAEQGSDWEM